MTSLHRTYFEWLQVARGIAAVAVVLTHAALAHERLFDAPFAGYLFSAGNVGVDFFFLLSGFIIYFVHQKDIGRPRQLRSYVMKRFTRVYPMFWVVTLLLTPLYFIGVGGQKSFEGDWGYVLKSFLLIPQDELPILSVAWTLTHEVYFYILFGLFLILPRLMSYLLVVGIVALSLWKMGMDYGQSWGGSKYVTGATAIDQSLLMSFALSRHTIQFFAGCFIAYLCLKRRVEVSWFALLGAYVIFFLPFVASVTKAGLFNEILTDKSMRTMYYTMASGLVVYCSIQFQASKQYFSPPSLLCKLGDSSYSLYLVHYPIIIACFIIAKPVVSAYDGLMSHLFTGAVIVISVYGGWIAFRWIETPVLNLSRKMFERSADSKMMNDKERVLP